MSLANSTNSELSTGQALAAFLSIKRTSLESLALVDAWYRENDEMMKRRISSNREPFMVYKVDLPQLMREWQEIADAR